MMSSVIAWMTPATGVLAPARMFVAVRAIAPVAGMPANKGEAKLARPCASSSTLELCLVPLIPSATTAESRLSTAARSATVSAEGNKGITWSSRNSGIESFGSPAGIPPNLLPIVSNGNTRQDNENRADQHRNNRAGNSLHEARQKKDDGERSNGNGKGRPANRLYVFQKEPYARNESAGHLPGLQSQECGTIIGLISQRLQLS